MCTTTTKLFIAFCLITLSIQGTEAKKKKPVSTEFTTSLEKAASQMYKVFDNVQDFFVDILDTITDLFVGGSSSTTSTSTSDKNNDWGENVVKATKMTLKSGYKVLKDFLPFIDMARSRIGNPSELNDTASNLLDQLLVPPKNKITRN